MSDLVRVEAFEEMIASLKSYSDDILNGTNAMTSAVGVCQEAMGSDE